jgi:signal transduction histidine kinase/CheY-like chemotaxis protein
MQTFGKTVIAQSALFGLYLAGIHGYLFLQGSTQFFWIVTTFGFILLAWCIIGMVLLLRTIGEKERVRTALVGQAFTERKRAEARLRQLNETMGEQVSEHTHVVQLRTLAVELIEAEEHERQRVAQILHDDLQQLLAAARFHIQAISPEPTTACLLENATNLLEESIAKLRRLSHELSPAVLHHAGLVDCLNCLIRQMNEQFELHISLQADAISLSEKSPLKIFLFRALQEFLYNVVKHAGVNTAQVALSGSATHITMTVQDEGQGFDPKRLDVRNATLPGFGLLSLRERAHHMGGRLEIHSAPGQGSRFMLSVPFVQTPSMEGQSIEPPETDCQASIILTETADADVSSDCCTRVLLVDDHQVVRQGLIKLLSGHAGIQVVGEASNGLEAIELVRQQRPNVVVMDISMPKMDGIEATRLIKAEWPDVRVIGLSMFEEEQIAQTMLEAGAEAFMSKTTSSDRLLEAIHKVPAQPVRV